MKVEGIGMLTLHDDHWDLVYDVCAHTQEFARQGLEDPERAVRYVQRQFAHCLICVPARSDPRRRAQSSIRF
jgi:hypothetical protein